MKEQTFQEYCDRVRKLEKRVKALEQEQNIITLTQKEYSDLCIQLKGLGWKFVQEQEPTSVKQDTVPVKLRINKVSKHISNIDLDELEQEPCDDTVSRGVFEQVKWERDIAIEQLHELGYELGQKIEPCDDVVSRQAALKELKESAEHHANDSREEALLRRDRDIIRALPPVTPQSKTGHWILTIEDWNKWTCSECGYYKRTDIHVSLGWKYCPKCGAHMVEPQESEVSNADSD